ncbi:MFS transporter [Paraburkholderia sp. BL17N1]|uniref:MFS transporter n=1 Tax=Paraburkholderia sp. BL17N1 TaxID=1938798 RepID=UPI000F26930C|nr:MFS transporter [Paraburkholderia sp. BL17N1]RKR45221.1 ACS family phthalate transporter-like MFS transporter [Paraburkholderia sp. BL17N1]
MNHSVQPLIDKWGEGIAGSSVVTDQQIQHTYRKVAFRLVPFLFLCWVVNYLDRVNLGFAKMSLSQDLALSDAAYGLGVGLFSIGYVLFEVPSNLMLEKIGARLTMTRIMVLWGAVTCSMMFIHNTTQFYLARILLGAAEAGFYPGLLLYLTYWFPSARRARITSRFLLSIAVSGIIGGPIAGWILHSFNNVAGLRDWQWLFLIEGLPAVLLGVIAYFYLDDKPKDAKWLTETERQILIDNIQADRNFKGATGHQGLLAVLRDPRVYVVVLASLVTPMLGIVMNYWIPTIIHRAGVKDILHVALLSSIPSIFGAIGMILIARHSDKHVERRWHYFFSILIGAIGLVLLPQVGGNPVLTIGCLSLLGIAYYAGSTMFWTIPPAYFSAASVAAGIALMSSLGQAGSLLTPTWLGWLMTNTHSIAIGLYTIAAIALAGGVIILVGVPAAALRERQDTSI